MQGKFTHHSVVIMPIRIARFNPTKEFDLAIHFEDASASGTAGKKSVRSLINVLSSNILLGVLPLGV